MSKKTLIVIEGTDGSGKETQTKILTKRLEEEIKNVTKISFPNYGSKACEPVKMYLAGEFGENPNEINPYAISTMYAIDRYVTINTELKNILKLDKCTIIADRYSSSNIVHQSVKIKNKIDRTNFIYWLDELEHGKFKIPRPTVTIFLDMPPEASKKLREGRANKITGEEKKDIHENDEDYLKEAYSNAKECALLLGWKIIKCVDDLGNIKTIEEIHDEIYSKIKDFL